MKYLLNKSLGLIFIIFRHISKSTSGSIGLNIISSFNSSSFSFFVKLSFDDDLENENSEDEVFLENISVESFSESDVNFGTEDFIFSKIIFISSFEQNLYCFSKFSSDFEEISIFLSFRFIFVKSFMGMEIFLFKKIIFE